MPPCKVVVDENANYPDCCPRYKCPKLEDNDDLKEVDISTNEVDVEGHAADGDQFMMESQQRPIVVRPTNKVVPEHDEEEVVSYDATLEDDSNMVSCILQTILNTLYC